jgi:hypothetical protein
MKWCFFYVQTCFFGCRRKALKNKKQELNMRNFFNDAIQEIDNRWRISLIWRLQSFGLLGAGLH